MNMEEVRSRAKAAGLTAIARRRKGELIRTIQRSEGNQECFGSAWRYDCPWPDCCWKEDCQNRNPG